jgi:hypothetical protein
MQTVQLAVLAGLLMLHGCSPTFNWREVRTASSSVQALFPCKPETSTRQVTLTNQAVQMTLLACEAGAASFALAYADTHLSTGQAVMLRAWQQATLANLRVGSNEALPYSIKGAYVSVPARRVIAQGMRPDNTAISVQALWFGVGSELVQVSVTSDVPLPEAVETFFAGIRIQ